MNTSLIVEVIGTDEFASWFDVLDDQATKAVVHGVDLLAQLGLALGHPYSSAINGASFALRELRVQAGGRPLRIFYAFDPARQAVLLIVATRPGRSASTRA